MLGYTAIDMMKLNQKGRYFADRISKIVWRLLYCDLDFTEVCPKVPINDKPSLF